jgi:exopolysaccharide biosynthesis polyprenyl glycosylphosphotransferase
MNTEQLAAGHPPSSHARRSSAAYRTANRRTAKAARPPRRGAVLVNRLLDVAIATALLALLALPMLAIAAIIKLTSPGPALYRQQRTGLGGKDFTMLKFRTMRCDAEDQSGPVWATKRDPRRTALGVLLRRLSIDELPQLINVIRGQMSLVGPRPERPFFVQGFSQELPRYEERHQVLPGITGWAQINGWRGDTSIERRLECDLYYIEHWSVAFNLRILLLTPFRVLIEHNAC